MFDSLCIITRIGDRKIVVDHYQAFLKLSDDEIIKACQKAKETGLFGCHELGLRLIALWNAAIKKGLEVDLKVEGNCLITFENNN